MTESNLKLNPDQHIGAVTRDVEPAPLPDAVWYLAEAIGDGLLYRFPAGALVGANYLTADTLLDGNHLAVFQIILQEGDNGPAFGFSFGLVNQCQARIRMPLEAVNQNRWMYPREGAWLKPRCQGQRVDLTKVDRMKVLIERKGPHPVRFCLTLFTATVDEPLRLADPLLPKGALLDELGQSTLHAWSTKSRNAEEVTARIKAQLAAAPSQRLPEGFSRWGGWIGKRLDATGFFRTAQADGRWWLVDPDGYVFWSSGPDCVRVDTEANYEGLETALAWLPDAYGPYGEIYRDRADWNMKYRMVNYLKANFLRAFGPDAWYEKWAAIALAELRRLGFNTVANWSDWEIARAAGVPYVRPMLTTYEKMPRVYRDFPDVFHPDFEQVCAEYADQLRETADDPAFIGYFLMNEPTWGFSEETPAAGMLFNTSFCYSRRALVDFLKDRYGTESALAAAWGAGTTFQAVTETEWREQLTGPARNDLADFSAIMVENFFGGLSRACKAVDPHHLNLGIRYYTVPPAWALAGMRHLDVFSMNCYQQRVPSEEMAKVNELLQMPILVGEWHFGALDAGLPAAGIGHVPDQEARGKAYRAYLEDAAAKPWCVGVHYFILYDQSALGRFDGENYNIGFLDVCDRPYESLAEAARLSHERMYRVAIGEVAPYNDAPEYLPLLFV
jgi:hypothetical protein